MLEEYKKYIDKLIEWMDSAPEEFAYQEKYNILFQWLKCEVILMHIGKEFDDLNLYIVFKLEDDKKFIEPEVIDHFFNVEEKEN